MAVQYTLTKQDAEALMVALYKTSNELLNKTSITQLPEKLMKFASFSECNLTQPDVGLELWIECGRMNKSIFEK